MENPRVTTLHDPEQGTFYLDHESQTFHRIPFPEMGERKSDTEATPQELREYAIIEESAKMDFTGRERQIGKWHCREFVIFDTYGSVMPEYLQSSLIAWIAADFENGYEIQKRKFEVSPQGLMTRFEAIIGRDFELPGFAIQMITREADNLPMVNTFKGISYEPLDSKDFEIPSDYTSVLE